MAIEAGKCYELKSVDVSSAISARTSRSDLHPPEVFNIMCSGIHGFAKATEKTNNLGDRWIMARFERRLVVNNTKSHRNSCPIQIDKIRL